MNTLLELTFFEASCLEPRPKSMIKKVSLHIGLPRFEPRLYDDWLNIWAIQWVDTLGCGLKDGLDRWGER